MNKKIFWIYALSSGAYFIQGLEVLPSQGLFYYFKDSLGFPPQKIMFLTGIISMSWVFKPAIGYLVDKLFNRRIWIFISLFSDIAAVLILGLLSLSLLPLVIFLMVNSTSTAFRDVAVDGVMCVEGKKYSITGRIQSVQWISISLAGLLTGIGGGYIAEKWGYHTAFLCTVPFYIILWVIAYFYQGEPGLGNIIKGSLILDLKKLFAHKQLMFLACFIFLYKYSPSFGAPLFFIQRDAFEWSKVWIGVFHSLGAIFAVLGALLYYKFSRRINIWKWLYFSVFLGAVITMSYLYYTPVTAVIYEIVYSFAGMFIFLMVMDFMARSTVTGLEATSFAFLCSVGNLATGASSLSGAFLLPIIGLQWLIVLSALTSFLCLFFINKITINTGQISRV